MPATPLSSRLRLKHLELFRHVMEQHTLLGAADRAYMTQPAATKLIQELERMVGVPLFHRGKAGMKPTIYGEVMHRHVSVILADLARMRDEISSVSQGGQGTVRLGVLPSLAPGLLTRAVVLMLKSHPNVRIHVREGSTNELLAAVSRNELDLAFARILDQGTSNGIRAEVVYDEPFAIVCRRGHSLGKRRSTSYQTLSRATWVLPAGGTPMRALVDQIFLRNRALRPTAAVECTTLDKLRDLIASTDMVGVLPRSFALEGASSRRLLLLKARLPTYAPISLAFRNQDESPPVVEEFARMAKASARELGLS